MATLNAVIIPAKVLKGGRHKIRISVAHNGETRYIVTNITIDSIKEFRNGVIAKRPDAAMLNTKLRGILQRYQEVIDELLYINGLTCAELVYQIKNAGIDKHRTLHSIYDEYMENARITPGTAYAYKYIWLKVSKFINENTLAENITHATILGLEKFLSKHGLKSTSIRNYLVFVRGLLNYAKRCGYVQFRIDPFAGYTLPKMEIRQSWMTVEEIKKIRDLPLKKKCLQKCRDLFMLSYYLGGINIVDLIEINFNEQKEVIHYIRQKTANRPKMNKFVEFRIPDEAKVIIAKYKGSDGRIKTTDSQRKDKLHRFFIVHFRTIANLTGIHQLVYYSARKSFSQHAFLLGVSTSVIDYILGHRVDKSSTSLYSYITVTPEMATLAVRKVLDNLK